MNSKAPAPLGVKGSCYPVPLLLYLPCALTITIDYTLASALIAALICSGRLSQWSIICCNSGLILGVFSVICTPLLLLLLLSSLLLERCGFKFESFWAHYQIQQRRQMTVAVKTHLSPTITRGLQQVKLWAVPYKRHLPKCQLLTVIVQRMYPIPISWTTS